MSDANVTYATIPVRANMHTRSDMPGWGVLEVALHLFFPVQLPAGSPFAFEPFFAGGGAASHAVMFYWSTDDAWRFIDEFRSRES